MGKGWLHLYLIHCMEKVLMCTAVFYSLYLQEGFLHLQNLVSMSIIELIAEEHNSSFEEIPVNMKVGFFFLL